MCTVVKKAPAYRTTGRKLKVHLMGPGYSKQNLSTFMCSKKKKSSLASKSDKTEVDAKWDKGLDQ